MTKLHAASQQGTTCFPTKGTTHSRVQLGIQTIVHPIKATRLLQHHPGFPELEKVITNGMDRPTTASLTSVPPKTRDPPRWSNQAGTRKSQIRRGQQFQSRRVTPQGHPQMLSSDDTRVVNGGTTVSWPTNNAPSMMLMRIISIFIPLSW
jgi:hypothetical protein